MLPPRIFPGSEHPGLVRLETGLAAAVLVMLSNAVIGPLFDPGETGGDAIGWLRLVWLPVYAVILALCAWRAPCLARFWRPGAILATLVAWAAISTLWSAAPDITGRRTLALGFTTLFGLYLAARFDGREFSELLAGTFLGLALASLAACLLWPAMAVHQEVNLGDWRGLWYEKNQMGAMMACGTLSAGVAASLSPARRRLWLAAAAICVGMAAMSRSATALIMLGLILAGLGLFHLGRRGPVATLAAAWLCMTAGGIFAAVAGLAPDAFFQALGKDPTITGRTDIWRLVEHWSDQAPVLGYGYAGFWTTASAPANDIRSALGWLVPNAHSGWLDLRLQLGWSGVVLCGGIFAVAVAAALLRGRTVKDGHWALMFLVIFLLSSLSESVILEQNTIFWALCVAALARLIGPPPVIARAPPRSVAGMAWGAPLAPSAESA
ncbi:MAG TPA: O-antigen ligase family protein [Caulobacteraceae bacterium]|nr:O-antigen ligase family protein [Caulobacteraceae bacterium]